MSERILQVNLDVANEIADAIEEMLKHEFPHATHMEVVAAYIGYITTTYVKKLIKEGVLTRIHSENSPER
jgi:hypothetical protein